MNQTADFGWGDIEYHSLNTGVPHVVLFVEDAAEVEVVPMGRVIRHSPLFPHGTNVNFVQIVDAVNLIVRTYERGVEDETLACGTGVVASALAAHRVRGLALPLRIQVRGGDIIAVNARSDENGGFHDVTLAGPATEVFTGEIKL